MRLAIVVMLVGCYNGPKHAMPLRPLEAGEFRGYAISACKDASNGYLVRGTREVEERGEAASDERVEAYRIRYLVPALSKVIEVKGWGTGTCANSRLVMYVVGANEFGEALHRAGETLRNNPTDIEVAIALGPPPSK
jgi:hypothetical protein